MKFRKITMRISPSTRKARLRIKLLSQPWRNLCTSRNLSITNSIGPHPRDPGERGRPHADASNRNELDSKISKVLEPSESSESSELSESSESPEPSESSEPSESPEASGSSKGQAVSDNTSGFSQDSSEVVKTDYDLSDDFGDP